MKCFDYRYFNTSPDRLMQTLATIGDNGWEAFSIEHDIAVVGTTEIPQGATPVHLTVTQVFAKRERPPSAIVAGSGLVA